VIDPGLLLAFVAAVALLIAIPGPNVALIVANSVAYGAEYGLLTVAGTGSAMVVQLALVGFGMAGFLGAFGTWFEWLRWAGVAYLLYMGVVQWRAPSVNLSQTRPEPGSTGAIYMRALLVSLTNPKTLFFYGAFFPQFIVTEKNVGLQLIVLSATFLVVAVALEGTWALAAGFARRALAAHDGLRNKLSGAFLIGAGAALALARVK
jgi:homoserine/homoserine lactone efflux protein